MKTAHIFLGLSSDYQGKDVYQPRYETIDIHNLAPGRYKLDLRVTDLTAGREAEKDFIFAVMP